LFSTGLYSGKFEFTYPVNVGDWAIVVDAFVCMPDVSALIIINVVVVGSNSSVDLCKE